MTARLPDFRALAAALLLLGGCASSPAGAPAAAARASQRAAAGPGIAARAAIDDLAAGYQSNDAERFLELFDEEGFSGFQAYAEGIRDFLRDNKEINLEVIFDSEVEDRGRVAAAVHWNKSLVAKAGRRVLSSGKCELVFRRDAKKGLLLSAIHGQSPF